MSDWQCEPAEEWRRPGGGALLLFHRGHKHSGRWRDTVDALGLDEVAVFAWDPGS